MRAKYLDTPRRININKMGDDEKKIIQKMLQIQ